MPKNFAWSWSRLKNYRACPKRHYEVDIAKTYKEVEGEALLWGNRFHDLMAKTIERGLPIPKDLESHRRWPELMIAKKQEDADIRVELKLAMSKDFLPTEWFDPKTWFRGVVDVLGLAPHLAKALAVDWKTGGSIKPEMEQLALNAQLIFCHHPEVDTVNTTYYWASHLDVEPEIKTYTRADMGPLWSRLLPEVGQMEEAARTMTYPPKPSGLCISYCPVTSCPFHGKGSR